MRDFDAELLRAILDEAAQRSYGGEAVDELSHALQTAYLAAASGADDELVLACALHDVGHLPSVARRTGTTMHEYVGGAFVAEAVSQRAGRIVAAHVRAKRYLVATEPDYRGKLSGTSHRTLLSQGGPLDAVGIAAFQRLPWAGDAIALRRWDDAAKVPGAPEIVVDDLIAIYASFRARR
ncbi:MAG TPA: HD domain-containing protein [Candidatus Elarobacter sp.]|jgi:gamma-butyrobetaine dioxygenase